MNLSEIIPQVSLPWRDSYYWLWGDMAQNVLELGAKKGEELGFLVNGQLRQFKSSVREVIQ